MAFDPTQELGKDVTFRGTAYNARSGAIVEIEDEDENRTPIYIDGLREWDQALDGKAIEVSGRLEERAAKVPPRPAGAPQVDGLASATFVLREARWTAVG